VSATTLKTDQVLQTVWLTLWDWFSVYLVVLC
jgi:hypothetical protein